MEQFMEEEVVEEEFVEEAVEEETQQVSTEETLRAQVAELQGKNAVLTDFANKNQQQNQIETQPKQEEFKLEALPDDLEEYSRAQLVELVQIRTLAQIEASVVKPLLEEISKLGKSQHESSAQSQIDKAQKDLPGFSEWGNEMADLINSGRVSGSNLKDAYTLARAEHPEKAQKLDAAGKPKPEAVTQTTTRPTSPLRPTQGETVATKTMNFHDAGQAAWTKIGQGIEDELRNMESVT